MGEEDKQAAEAKADEAPKPEEKPTAEQKEDTKPSPPPPLPTVLFVDLHCVGCAKKIERAILKCRGVEEVETNIAKNEVTVRGIVDPQALCSRIHKKTSRNAKVLFPLSLPSVDASDSTKPDSPPAPQATAVATVELRVSMHCEACGQQLRKKIMKMRGVQSAETDPSANKVTVIGTMDGDKLMEYIYRRTGKIARVIPPPPPPSPSPPPPQEEKKEEKEMKGDGAEKPSEEKKEGDNTQEKKEEADEEKPSSEGSKEEKQLGKEAAIMNAEEMVKRMMYWNGAAGNYVMSQCYDDEMAKRMMMMHHWMPMPMPMPMPMQLMPPPPPPQIFSDENPNACSIL